MILGSEKNADSASLGPPLLRPLGGLPILLCPKFGAGMIEPLVGRTVVVELYVGDSEGDRATLAPSEERFPVWLYAPHSLVRLSIESNNSSDQAKANSRTPVTSQPLRN